MPVLNEGLRFDQLPADARRAFLGRGIERQFPAGWALYKFTKRSLGGGDISPWWSSVEPLTSGDPGLAGTLERAERLGVDPQRMARVRSAVTQQWNTMDGLLRVLLVRPVWGVYGRCASQRVDSDLPSNIVFIGGAWQVYLPNLTTADIHRG